MNRVYCDKMDGVRLSTGGKQNMVAGLVAGEQKTTSRPRRVLRTGLVAAVIVGLMTVATGAALLMVPVLRDYYGGAGYDQSAGALGYSFTQDGWTMTLTDCVGDDNYLYLGLELAAPAGTKLDEGPDGTYQFKQFGFRFHNIDRPSIAHRLEQVPDASQTDNRLHFILWIEKPYDLGSLSGYQMELQVGGLYNTRSWNEEKQDYDYIHASEVPWVLGPLTITYPDNAIRLTPNTPVALLDVTANLASVEVTPIGVTVEIKGDALKGHHKKYNSGYCHALPEIVLYDKDGKAVMPDQDAAPFGIRGGSGCSGGSDKTEDSFLRIVQSYGYLLDLNALDHIEVCGVSIPLP